ncbi:complement factor I isoform X2 [Tachysurus ichikawai]
MMRITLVLLLSVLLVQLGRTVQQEETRTTAHNQDDQVKTDKGPTEDSPGFQHTQHSQKPSKPRLNISPPPPTAHPNTPPPSLFSQECRSGNYTRLSCAKVFCPPWQRCINGQCVCKLPYQCPRTGPGACGLDGKSHLTLCHSQAHACRYKKPIFSHYTQLGSCAGEEI